MSEIKIEVAKKLGWATGETPLGRAWLRLPCGDEMYSSTDYELPIISMAAYAKAEMAKRGWTPSAEGTTAGFAIQFFDEYGEQASLHPGGGAVTEPHEYNPSDPISEAHATLSAIAEALCL